MFLRLSNNDSKKDSKQEQRKLTAVLFVLLLGIVKERKIGGGGRGWGKETF